MKVPRLNSNETDFLEHVDDFFQIRSVENHLRFIDQWLELMHGGKMCKHWRKPGNLFYSYETIAQLFDNCSLLLDHPSALAELTEDSDVTEDKIALEKSSLSYFPYYLSDKEMRRPVKVIEKIFERLNNDEHQRLLKDWIAETLNDAKVGENGEYITPLYSHMKKLVGACWLIQQRIINKHNPEVSMPAHALHRYALTEPHLLTIEDAEDPFRVIEDFFSFTNLTGYRAELQDCFMSAINMGVAHNNPSTLLFIHDQYNLLLQAGYLIVERKLTYIDQGNKDAAKPHGAWLLGVRDRRVSTGELALSDEQPHALSMDERDNPMAYCVTTLTHEGVALMRYGLQEWLRAGLSASSSLEVDMPEFGYTLYVTLQKLTEAFYLILTESATGAQSVLKEQHHE